MRRSPRESNPQATRVAEALRYAYGPVLARAMTDPSEGRLGIAPPSYARSCVRNHAMIQQLCRELGEYWWRIAQYNRSSSGSAFKREERRQREEAGLALIDAVRTMPQPLREVVELRALGLTWKQISEALPHRVYFSITDDWRRGLQWLSERHDDLVAKTG